MAIKAVLFDAYGTLLDISSATAQLVAKQHYPALADKAEALTSLWRTRQVEYSWLRTAMADYTSFWQITQDALDYALDATGLAGDAALRADLLALYADILPYEDALGCLRYLADHNTPCAILSNGNQAMLDRAVSHAGLTPYLTDVLSVEPHQTFKPSAVIYQMGASRFDAAADEILFFSSNGWDIAGASHFGFQTIWVNRQSLPVERLPGKPHHIVSSLTEARPLLQGHYQL